MATFDNHRVQSWPCELTHQVWRQLRARNGFEEALRAIGWNFLLTYEQVARRHRYVSLLAHDGCFAVGVEGIDDRRRQMHPLVNALALLLVVRLGQVEVGEDSVVVFYFFRGKALASGLILVKHSLQLVLVAMLT